MFVPLPLLASRWKSLVAILLIDVDLTPLGGPDLAITSVEAAPRLRRVMLTRCRIGNASLLRFLSFLCPPKEVDGRRGGSSEAKSTELFESARSTGLELELEDVEAIDDDHRVPLHSPTYPNLDSVSIVGGETLESVVTILQAYQDTRGGGAKPIHITCSKVTTLEEKEERVPVLMQLVRLAAGGTVCLIGDDGNLADEFFEGTLVARSSAVAKTLKLRDLRYSGDIIVDFFKAIRRPGEVVHTMLATHIDASAGAVGDLTIHAQQDFITFAPASSVDLSGNRMSDEKTAAVIIAAMRNPTLRRLNLSRNGLGFHSLKALILLFDEAAKAPRADGDESSAGVSYIDVTNCDLTADADPRIANLVDQLAASVTKCLNRDYDVQLSILQGNPLAAKSSTAEVFARTGPQGADAVLRRLHRRHETLKHASWQGGADDPLKRVPPLYGPMAV